MKEEDKRKAKLLKRQLEKVNSAVEKLKSSDMDFLEDEIKGLDKVSRELNETYNAVLQRPSK